MGKRNFFKFLDDELNQQLIGLLKMAKINHVVGKDGAVYYSPAEQGIVENDFICTIRYRVYPSWQVLTCPRDWTKRYKKYMNRHGIPFHEELINGDLWFLLPRKYRPGRWKLESPMKAELMAVR